MFIGRFKKSLNVTNIDGKSKPALSVLQCRTAPQNLEAKPNCQIKTATQTKALRTRFSLSCAKVRENDLGTENHREQCALFLWAAPYTSWHWQKCKDGRHTCRQREKERERENRAPQEGPVKLTALLRPFNTHVHHWVTWGFVLIQLLVNGDKFHH
jgi:hypothetical protein